MRALNFICKMRSLLKTETPSTLLICKCFLRSIQREGAFKGFCFFVAVICILGAPALQDTQRQRFLPPLRKKNLNSSGSGWTILSTLAPESVLFSSAVNADSATKSLPIRLLYTKFFHNQREFDYKFTS